MNTRKTQEIRLPRTQSVVARVGRADFLSEDGEVLTLDAQQARELLSV